VKAIYCIFSQNSFQLIGKGDKENFIRNKKDQVVSQKPNTRPVYLALTKDSSVILYVLMMIAETP